jgi:cyclase
MINRPKRAGAFLLAIGLAFASGRPAPARDQAGDIPADRFVTTRLSSRLLLVKDAKMDNNTAVVRTSRGLVVVDSGETVEVGRAIRKIIEGEFPGEPFVYVLNTHSHWDHVLGNPAFPEATIVAHENCRQAMMKIETRTPAAPVGENPVAAAGRPASTARSQIPPPPPAVGQVGVAVEFLEDTLPDLTFTDRMTLHCGDRTFRLVYFGYAHTVSDILVFIPEDKTLFVGDLFFKDWLPGFNEWLVPDVERWRAGLEEVLRKPGLCETVVSGHGAVIPRADLEAQARYAFDLWDGLARAFRDGRTLEETRREFALASRYPGLVDWNIKDSAGRTVHDENIRKIWKHLIAEPPDGDGPCTDGSKTI